MGKNNKIKLVSKKKFYIIGVRPVYVEIEESNEEIFSFDWNTGDFKEDFSYYGQIFHGPDTTETVEVTESEFNNQVEKLRLDILDSE